MTHADIINLWPSLSDFAFDLSIEYGTAKAMRRRNSIPPNHWRLLVERASARGLGGVTYEALASAVAGSAAA